MTETDTFMLILFTKSPFAAEVKTRLRPALSDEECRRLQDAFIRGAIGKFRGADFPLTVCYTPADEASKEYFAGFGVPMEAQGEGDLGVRMRGALERAFRAGARKAVLVGADIPHLGIETIREAFALLEGADAVFGPAEDGGYYLVGVRGRVPAGLFEGIPWSSAETLSATIEKAAWLGLKVSFGERMFDVDTMEDLRRLGAVPGLPPETRKIVEALCPRMTLRSADQNISGDGM